jgi:hypothetical protein
MSIPTEKQVRMIQNDKEARIQQYGKGSAKAIDNRLYESLGSNVEGAMQLPRSLPTMNLEWPKWPGASDARPYLTRANCA